MPDSGRFDGDVARDQEAAGDSGEARQGRHVRDEEHRRHQNERDRRFGGEGDRKAAVAGQRHDVVHGRISEGRSEHSSGDAYTARSAYELGEHVEGGVCGGNLAEAEEGEGQARIDVRSRAAPPGGIDDGHTRQSHRRSHEHATHGRVGNRGVQRRSRVLEQHAERARRDHEGAEPGRLDEILRPVEVVVGAGHARWMPLACSGFRAKTATGYLPKTPRVFGGSR